ncbi:DJ-1/PfpI family protein [Salinisphaera japonica]|uniref:Thiazole biosynthesis protein ThiJ n=1 Tax=Salinisphaera japonica YTM-1 TaxID=1209778 RepID=A0A423PEN6_9GAMM|nr:DJ-1/PfpI family protein [Salinisphaera japonica]ROO24091.1 thiazole biosynthesis protein ThiJ [Salinisphaera japonica YTM-1]
MRVGFLVFDDLEELDLLGAWELFGVWADFNDGPSERLLIGEHAGPVRCAKGLQLLADVSLADGGALDVLIVPGGWGTRAAALRPAITDFVAHQARQADVLAVCTGAFVLAAAGLLSGRSATTHFASLDRLRALGDVDVLEARYVQAGSIWTSAGISAGMDMTLAYIAHKSGDTRAGDIQRWAEYYPETRRYGGQALHRDMPAYVSETRG